MKKNLLPVATSLLCALAMSTTLATNAECCKKSSSTSGENTKADNKAYLEEISNKITKNYSVPSGFDVVKAKIGFDMDANGNVNHLRLLDDEDAPAEGQSSVTRTALIKAIKNSAPFPSPGSVKKPVRMVASFDKTNAEKSVICTVQMK
jgi:hypothetical protein